MNNLLRILRPLPQLLTLLWLHCIAVPAAMGATILVLILVFTGNMGDLVDARLDALKKQESAIRAAPAGHAMTEVCKMWSDGIPPAEHCSQKAVPLSQLAADDISDIKWNFVLWSILGNGIYWIFWRPRKIF